MDFRKLEDTNTIVSKKRLTTHSSNSACANIPDFFSLYF